MKNILIISYLFAPKNAIGAIRPTKFAKYLTKLGYKVDVICAFDNNDSEDTANEDTANISCIHRIEHSDKYKNLLFKVKRHVSNNSIKSTNQKEELESNIKKSKLRKYKSKIVRFLIRLLGDIDFYSQFKKYINNSRLKLSDYDVVISTFGPSSNHYIANYIKKKNYNMKWIADFRDNMYGDHIPFGFKTYIKYIQNLFCKKSNYITVISKGCLDQIISGRFFNKSSVITNGYDKNDISNINLKKNGSTKFTLTYTGSTYEGKRDLSILFFLINVLHNEGKIDKNNIQFFYAGNDGEYVKNQAKKYDCQDIVLDIGFVSRTESLELQNQSQILIVSTWNDKKNKGILSGKFFEYMIFDKPIIAIVSGDVKNSEINEIINECELGYCYEEIQHSQCIDGLKEYILEQYTHYLDIGDVFFEPSIDKKDKYNYINLTTQLANIIEKL
jgi:hypothetical protein